MYNKEIKQQIVMECIDKVSYRNKTVVGCKVPTFSSMGSIASCCNSSLVTLFG